MKAGDICWIKTVYKGVEQAPSDGYQCDVYYGMSGAGDELPDHPALPAVARWLAGLPDWLDAAELAGAIASVVEASKEAQARLVIEDTPIGYERRREYVAACKGIKLHGWEALDALVAALTEEQG